MYFLYTVDALHNDSSRGSSTVTDRRTTIFSRFKLMEQCCQDPRAGAPKGVAKRDGTANRIDYRVFETKNLRG